ncbi:Somatostatin receptor type 5 [Taenia solium]|eukprot:TsM_001056300 transcript=TsM_001056300 gene=TsM_001056300
MSIADAVFLLSSLLYLQTMNFCGRSCRRIAYLLPVSTLVNIFEMLRNWTVVLVCIERYIITCHPLRSKRWLSLPRTNTSIAICVIATVLARIPFMVYVTLESYGATFASTANLLKQIHSTIDAVLVTLLPLLIIVVCSLRIYRCIQDSEMLHRMVVVVATSHSASTRKRLKYRSNNVKVTRVLLVVIVVFTILMLPLVPVNILAFEWFFPGATCHVLIGRQIVDPLAVLGSLLHSMANFLIYVICWQKYRRILLTICRGTNRNRQSSGRSSTFCSNDGVMSRSLPTARSALPEPNQRLSVGKVGD